MLGFSGIETGFLTLGKWLDLFNYYKEFHDFETKKYLFNSDEEEQQTAENKQSSNSAVNSDAFPNYSFFK